MDVLNLRVLLRRYFVLVALFVVVGAAIGAGLELRKQGDEVASVSVYADNELGDTTLVSQDQTLALLRMDSFVRVVSSDVLARALIQRLDLQTTPGALSGRISATNDSDTVVMRISVTGTDAGEVARIARAIPRELTRAVASLDTPRDEKDTDGRSDVTTFTVLDGPKVDPASSKMRVAISTAFGALLGLALSLALASVLLWRSDRRTPSSYVADTRLPVLGMIPRGPAESPDDPEYSRLAANLGLTTGRSGRFVAVAASDATQSGAVAVGLSRAMARRGRSVLLIDAAPGAEVAGLVGLEPQRRSRSSSDALGAARAAPDDPDLRVCTLMGEAPGRDNVANNKAIRQELLDTFRRAGGTADLVVVAGRSMTERNDLPHPAEYADTSLLVVDPERDSHDDVEAAAYVLGALRKGDAALVMHGVNSRLVPATQLQSGFVPVPPAAVETVGETR